MSTSPPQLSVIVPAHQAARLLPETLPTLLASDLPREQWELVVVDDASTDETAVVAAQYADTVIRLAGNPHGPAYARNRGAEVSRGAVLVFFDADVRARRDTLRRLAELFAQHPEISAAFGAYDTEPPSPGLVSQYRNLLHHYVHQQGSGEAETFWAGCGAVRRVVFIEVGMFDEWHYHRPQIEDIELGRRLRRLGHRILLQPDIQVTHLKHWTFTNVLETDFKHRGVPWMWLLLQEGSTPAALNLRHIEKWCTVLVCGAVLALASAPFWGPRWMLAGAAAGVALGVALLLNYRFYRFLRHHRSLGFAFAAIPLHMLYYLSNGFSVLSGWLAHSLFGEPQPTAETAALVQIGVKTWPPAPSRPGTGIWSLKDDRSSSRSAKQ